LMSKIFVPISILFCFAEMSTCYPLLSFNYTFYKTIVESDGSDIFSV